MRINSPDVSQLPNDPRTEAHANPAASAPGPTRSIALLNQKGGVGKTTTTANIAAAIARAGRRVLLLDLDPQAHLTLHFGVEVSTPEGNRPTVYDLLLDDLIRIEDVAVEARPNLLLIPAHVDLAAAEMELAVEVDRHHRLRRKLAESTAASLAEFIFIDCPPSLGLLTLNALAAVKEVIVPMQAHFLALQGLSKLLETVRLVSNEVNPGLRVNGVALCMFEGNTKLATEVVADLNAFFESAKGQPVPWRNCRILRPVIRRNIKLAESPSFGQSIFEYDPSCPGAADYQAMAENLIREWDAFLARRSSPGVAVRPMSPAASAGAAFPPDKTAMAP